MSHYRTLEKAQYSPENVKATHRGLCPGNDCVSRPRGPQEGPGPSPLTDRLLWLYANSKQRLWQSSNCLAK